MIDIPKAFNLLSKEEETRRIRASITFWEGHFSDPSVDIEERAFAMLRISTLKAQLEELK